MSRERHPGLLHDRPHIREQSPRLLVTAENRATHRFVTVEGIADAPIGEHRPKGKLSDALRDAVAQIDELDGEWYVRSISTPDSILADLHYRVVERSLPHTAGETELIGRAPEAMMLARIKRDDLFEHQPGPHRKSRRGGSEKWKFS